MATVRQLLQGKKPGLFTVSPDAVVLEAIRAMAEHRVGALLVTEGARLVGIVSERDYARKIILLGRSSSDTPVRAIMSSPVLTVGPEDTVAHCMALMTERHVRHLPALEGATILGMISIGDLVKAVIAEQRAQIEQLENYIRS
ncbi:MAG: CBS domain-containing protein [Proteobacteria bacterium]|nr:CBS domain-containing protein [Pseudomonadota bacterium]